MRVIVFCVLICVLTQCALSSQEANSKIPMSHPTMYTNNFLNENQPEELTNETKIERYPLLNLDFERVQTPIIIAMWLFLACIGKIAFHMAPKISHMFPESVMIIVLGLLIGGLLVYANPNPDPAAQVSPLTADTFFLYLLPPIILDAGYFMPNRLFFDHLGTILTFAVIGTIWNAMTIGISMYALARTGIFGDPEAFPVLHIFLFSSLISAVDPVAVLAVFEEIQVEEVLFILVFGESLLNDGVTVVLYHMFEGFSEIGEDNIILMDIVKGLVSFFLVALGGTAIGVIWGFFAAFITRFTYQVRVIEPMFIFVMSYLSYLNAELFHFSGILAITFCGITMKNYTEQNISQKSSTTIKYAMKMLASSSETVIFLFLGVATIHGTVHDFNGWFIFFTILFCSVYRVIGILILSAVCNRFRVQKIDFVQKFVMCYGGLRGAVAFALAITIDPSLIKLAPTFVTTTIAVVFFTVFIQGISIEPLVEKLGVKKSEKRADLRMSERLHERTMDYIMAGIEDIVGKMGKHYIRGWFKRLNNNYIQPRLVRNSEVREPKFLQTLSNLKMQDALNYMRDTPTNEISSVSQILHSNLYSKNSVKEWNLDLGELEYKPSDRDLMAQRLHHILAENYMAGKRRQSTYKRHAVTDEDLQTNDDFHNKMMLHANQVAMSSIRNRKKKSSGVPPKLGARMPNLNKENGTAIRLKDDYLQETAFNNPGYLDDNGLPVHDDTEDYPNMIVVSSKPRYSIKGPTAAETTFPWKRFSEDRSPLPNTKASRTMSLTPSEGGIEEPQTMAEVLLPWKRNEDDISQQALQQKEFPAAWISSMHPAHHYSPSNTLLNNITSSNKKPSIQEIFDKKHPNLASGSRRGSLADEMPALRNSAKDDIYLRRSSLRDDSMLRRGSAKDIWDSKSRTSSQSDQLSSLSPAMHDKRRNSRIVSTVIPEEEPGKLQKKDYTEVEIPPDQSPPGGTKF